MSNFSWKLLLWLGHIRELPYSRWLVEQSAFVAPSYASNIPIKKQSECPYQMAKGYSLGPSTLMGNFSWEPFRTTQWRSDFCSYVNALCCIIVVFMWAPKTEKALRKTSQMVSELGLHWFFSAFRWTRGKPWTSPSRLHFDLCLYPWLYKSSDDFSTHWDEQPFPPLPPFHCNSLAKRLHSRPSSLDYNW